MAIEHSPESDCILRGFSTQVTYFTLQRPHFSKLLSPRAARDSQLSRWQGGATRCQWQDYYHLCEQDWQQKKNPCEKY
jgi:hypothetical protein